MEESKYTQLREQLRQQASRDAANQLTISNYVHAVADYINRQHARTQRTCDAGVVRSGSFVRDEVDTAGSKAQFALRVQFHYANGDLLYQRAVQFASHIVGDIVHIDLADQSDAIQLTIPELSTEEGMRALAGLVDQEVEGAVNAVLGIVPDFYS